MRAGEHVFHESLVPRHVDKADAHITQIKIGETNVDRDAASFLFRQPICIDARQRAHQRRLAMVDMAGGADDDGFHNLMVIFTSEVWEMSAKVEATIEDLYHVPENGKAELVNGEIVTMPPTGEMPSRASGSIYFSLRLHESKTDGRAYPDNAGFLVRLPHRR